MIQHIHSPSPLAGESGSRRLTDEGDGSATLLPKIARIEPSPSSAPSVHLLPQGEKERQGDIGGFA